MGETAIKRVDLVSSVQSTFRARALSAKRPEYFDTHVQFHWTNESLESIVSVLNPRTKDLCLAICGSGDQPFGLAEHGARVHAIDYAAAQIRYAQHRAAFLKKGQYEKFLTAGRMNLKERVLNYFTAGQRLSRIQQHLSRISFHEVNLFQLPSELLLPYTKVYLSNAPTYCRSSPTKKELKPLCEQLPSGALVYVACGVTSFSHLGFKRDEQLTKRARKKEDHWDPVVYRRL